MSDKPLRRHIMIVLDLAEDGSPREINRAHSSDEYHGRSGAIEMSPAINVDEASLAGLLPDLAAVVAQLTATQDDLSTARVERDEAVKSKEDAEVEFASKIKEAEDRAADAIAVAEADRDEKVASAETAKAVVEADLNTQLVEKEAKIAELEARIAELTTVPERVIHKAYLRAALASIDKLAEVDAAVTAAGVVQWELWANATTISQDDPEVNAIATALNIDLAVIFELAHEIRRARGG